MIEYSKFTYNQNEGTLIRQKYGLKNNEKVIGIVGRISKQKNQAFALKVLTRLLQEKINVKLMIVGDYDRTEADYYRNVKKYINDNGLVNDVIFTGLINNLGKYYSAFDILWLPSLYEGMPTVGIEAQANGLPILASDMITKSMKIINNVVFLNTKNKESLWAEKTKDILSENRDLNAIKKINQSLFNTNVVVNKWEKLYGRL